MSIFHHLVILCLFQTVFSYPHGAPNSVCDSMLPGHVSTQPQSSEPVYSIVGTSYNGSISVTIEGRLGEATFRGLFLRVRYTNGSKVRGGRFVPSEHSKTVDCDGDKESALTHTSREEKNTLKVSWIPPPLPQEDAVVFVATIVRDFNTYWVGVTSDPIIPPITNTSRNEVPVTTEMTIIPSTANILDLNGRTTDLYSGCGVNKGCFGMPRNCIEKKACEVVLNYSVNGKIVQFLLVGALGSKSGWIAMGLSRDNKMGDDAVTECAHIGDNVVVRESWNRAYPKYTNMILNQVTSVSEQRGEYEDGVITCSWSRPFESATNGITFILHQDVFYVLLAKGPMGGSGEKLKHNVRLSSANAVNLTSASVVIGKPSTLIKVHGSLMTVAWVGLVSLGIFIARHYKEVWTKYKLCGSKVWFSVHRCFMLLSLTFVVSASAAIFVDVDGWSDILPNPHAILGCVSTCLIVIQPFIAVCRPQPTSPNRVVFRWIHGMIGNIAQFGAWANMFLAVQLKDANLPEGFYWVLMTFITFHCLIHLLIHVHSCFMERERVRESANKLNQFQLGDGYEINEDAPGSAFKKFALGLYTLVTAGLTAGLVLMITLN